MLTAIPKHWFSWDFIVMDGTQAVGDIDVSSWREKGLVTIQGVDYRMQREGLVSGDFVLASRGSVLARAQKPSAFRRTFTIAHGDKRYTLKATSAFRRAFELLDGNRVVGSLSPRSMFTRRADVQLPESLPLPLKLFIIWLAVILWKREAESAGT